MRRTLLSVLVAIASFVVTAFVLVVGYTLVAGRSAGPSQGSRQPVVAKGQEPNGPKPSTPPQTSAPHSSPPSSPGSTAPPTEDPQPSDEPVTPAAESDPTAGLLSQDFRQLGLDDPSTPLIDESLRSACDTVDGVIAGPALCPDR